MAIRIPQWKSYSTSCFISKALKESMIRLLRLHSQDEYPIEGHDAPLTIYFFACTVLHSSPP